MRSNWNIKYVRALVFLLSGACVQPIEFDVPPARFQTVVEGLISDEPGPYTVKLSKAIDLNSDSLIHIPIEHADIKLYDDEGNVESFNEINPGEYVTTGIIQGRLDHEYHIRVETSDKKIFESYPDKINRVGELKYIRYEFEARTKTGSFGEVQADVFNIYIDADAPAGDESYVRWKFNGTYKVITNPELHTIFLQASAYLDPLPCSGYIVTPALGGGKLEKVEDCFCCTCWVNQFEELPQLSDVQFISSNQFKNVKLAEVPITPATFYDKYMVEVQQLSLSRTAFDFFKLVRAQKEGASNLFQPPSGEIIGNVYAVNSDDSVIGLFWATSSNSKSIFISKDEVPYPLPPIYFVPDACTKFYKNSSTQKPKLWE